MIMKPAWVTVAARPAVGFLAREVRAEMTALSVSTAAAASGTGLIRRDEEGSACAGRWLPAADEGGPDGKHTRSSRTTRPATPGHASAACASPRAAPGRKARVSGCYRPAARRPLLAAPGGLSAVPGDRPHYFVPTSLAASYGAAASRLPQPHGRTGGSRWTPYRGARSGNAALARTRSHGARTIRVRRSAAVPGPGIRRPRLWCCSLPETPARSDVRCR